MSKMYHIEVNKGVTTIRFTDKPDINVFKMIIDELAEKDIYERRMWIMSPHGLTLDPLDRKQIASYGKAKFTKPSRLSIVASDDLSFGICRAFEAYRGDDNFVKCSVFRNEDKAREWICRDD